MSLVELERMLCALLPSPGPTALTITEAPESDEQLRVFVESAARIGGLQRSRLAEVHVPRGRLGALAGCPADVRVGDGGEVLRLVFVA